MNMPKSRDIQAKIAITAGDLECILARNCEGTEQLRILKATVNIL